MTRYSQASFPLLIHVKFDDRPADINEESHFLLAHKYFLAPVLHSYKFQHSHARNTTTTTTTTTK